jgi:hypothetical protein
VAGNIFNKKGAGYGKPVPFLFLAACLQKLNMIK